MLRKLLFILLLLQSQIGWSEVIVHKTVPLEEISHHYLLSVFSMRIRTWPDGQPVHVFVLPSNNDDHKKFVKEELGVFPYQLSNMWDRAVFSGAGQSPVLVDSAEEMVRMVNSTPGAIGYVMTQIQGGNDVKTVSVK